MSEEVLFISLPTNKEGSLKEKVNLYNIERIVPFTDGTISVVFKSGKRLRFFITEEEFNNLVNNVKKN